MNRDHVLIVMPFVVSAAVLGALVASAGSALAVTVNEHQVRKCTYGLLFDASRLTCDLAHIVDPEN